MIDKSEMIFGIRAVIEAVQGGKDIDKILVKKDIQSDLSKELFAALKGTLIPVQRVPVERINRITRKNHQGVIAFVSAVTYQKTEDLVPFLFEEGKNPLFVMLDGTTDVRNFGAIARTCECAAAVSYTNLDVYKRQLKYIEYMKFIVSSTALSSHLQAICLLYTSRCV